MKEAFVVLPVASASPLRHPWPRRRSTDQIRTRASVVAGVESCRKSEPEPPRSPSPPPPFRFGCSLPPPPLKQILI
ncbi:hypothetical protein U1Q18_032342 [Sarracenia purpurea var. burkii]